MAAASGAGEARSTGEAIRALAAGCVGNFVEWYDFAIYSYSITIIATLFFPEGNRTAAIIAAFALYGVAFLARPVGGVFWGSLGDRIGRRTTLAVIVLIMGGATMLIGLLPTYGTIGVLAPILLAVLRLIQGFSGGGEFTGSTSFISEYAPDEKRGLFASISATFTTLPSLLGGLTVFAVAAGLGEEVYASWGWRIPFLVGGPLALVGLFIRLRMDETPAFRELKEREEQVESTPAREAIREHGRSILLVFAIASLSALGAYTLGTYFPTYLQEVVGLSRTTAIAANFLAFFVTVPLVPLVGWLGDRIGRKPLLLIGAPGFILLSVPGYMLASTGNFFLAILGQLLVALPWSFVVSAVVVIIVEIFPTRVRYSGASIGYNLGYMIFGGSAPIVATALVSATGSDIAPAIYLIVVAVLVLPAIFLLPETRRLSPLRDADKARPSGSTEPGVT
ncbi:MAG TPA: MFS transporter [Rubrobacter sp.]|nr:MFS transporter [Rubrobacter sp.]